MRALQIFTAGFKCLCKVEHMRVFVPGFIDWEYANECQQIYLTSLLHLEKTCQTVNYSHLSLKIYLFKIHLVMSERFNIMQSATFKLYFLCSSLLAMFNVAVSTQQKHKLNSKYACFQDKFSSTATEVRLTLYSELQTEML